MVATARANIASRVSPLIDVERTPEGRHREMELTCNAPAFDNEKAAMEGARRLPQNASAVRWPTVTMGAGSTFLQPDRLLIGRGDVTIFTEVEFDQRVDERTTNIIKK